MTEQVALILGYAVLYVGGSLLAVLLLILGGWGVVELWWKRYGNLKELREFMEWKHRGRFKITEETVAAHTLDKCDSCGVHTFENCPRGIDHPCLREHCGGTREARV